MTIALNKPAVAPEPAPLLDVPTLARLLRCSTTHLRRMHDAGRMPRCVRIGSLLRWRRDDIERWITSGCPARSEGGGR